MYKLKNIFLAAFLSLCITVSSMPLELMAQEDSMQGQEKEDIREQKLYEIMSFEELTEEASNLIVPVGTAPEELTLPETLTVSYRPYQEEQDNEKKPGEDGGVSDNDPGDDNGGGVSDNDPGDGNGGGVSDNDPGDGNGGGEEEKKPGEENGGGEEEKKPGEENGGEEEEKKPGGENGEGEEEKNPGEENGGGEEEKKPGEENGGGEDEKNPGEENNPGGDTGAGENEGNPGGESDGGENAGNPGGESGGGENESSPVENGEEQENENSPGSDPAGEAVTVQTVEVHMKEYLSQPEIVVESKTLTPDEEAADAGENAADRKAGGEGADGGSEADAGTGAETDTQTAVIENITWQSAPAYDGDTEGCYLFTPVLPETYGLAEGVALPEITVIVEGDSISLNAVGAATPGGGVISTDTVWSSGTLGNVELTVEPGVTLTINGCITVTGKVTIKGGGTIKRGSAAAYFNVSSGADLTVGEITLEGSSIQSNNSMISVNNAKILLDDGCRIKNCHKTSITGAALYVQNGEAVLNDVTIEGCSGVGYGGTISLRQAVLTVNGGTYRNNSDRGIYAGSVLYSMYSKVYIYGGKFIDNVAEGSILSGCIFDIGCTQGNYSNETHIYGGYFEGNRKASQGFGGGAIICPSSHDPTLDRNTIFELSGDVRFCGDGVEGSGTDGFFLEFEEFPRKIHVGAPLTSPVYVYLKAQEGYVIAKGSNNGYILTEKDMKQIRFTDVGNSGKQWYAWLDREKNEIYLSAEKPPYGLYVYYSSNGAAGKVEDNTEYASGADVTVKPADALSMEGRRFQEWNTRPDGKGTPYSPGASFKITEDVTLYAIFSEGSFIKADFYSGAAGRKEVISEELEEDATSVTITAPELKDMDDWTKVGWDDTPGDYTGAVKPGDRLTLSKNTSYYGVYTKDVTLSYDANGGKADDLPQGNTGECRANVHDEITYHMPEFRVAGGITADNPEWEFAGWNTERDGTGDTYSTNDTIKISEDTTLYAIFVKPPYAHFYSGRAGYCDRRGSIAVSGAGIGTTGKIIAPQLKELEGKTGWEAVGWDEDKDGFDGGMEPGRIFELTADEDKKPYYGVYEKSVTLSYQAVNNDYGAGSISKADTQTRKAKVCETEILYDPGADDPDGFTFAIAADLAVEGHPFLGWNTKADGTGDFYRADDAERNEITITEDTVLYGIFKTAPAATFYSGSAGQYERIQSTFTADHTGGTLTTPALKEMEGWEPAGWSRSETGYGESVECGSGLTINISEDTVYYGVYKKKVELSYDTNGWRDTPFDAQSKFCYANVHSEVTAKPAEFAVGNDIGREGYSFRGWSLERVVSSFAESVCYMPEDTVALTDSTVLYAQMADDIPPVLGEAVYSEGSRDVKDWKVSKKDMVLTVPITEKGSGVNKIVYTFTPENGEPVSGEAAPEDAGGPGRTGGAQAVRLEAAGGGDAVSAADIKSAEAAVASGGQVGTTDGQIRAKITISEDYKGSISLMCRDNAGNESPLKLLTAQGGGVIVEDNAPLITFWQKGMQNGRAVVEVTVYDNADEDSSSRITGGIASVNYQTDDKEEQSVTDQGFAEGIVETCTFEVQVAGAGAHTIKVTAADNAGNESSRSTDVRIAGNKKETTVIEAYAPPADGGGTYEPPGEPRRAQPPMEDEQQPMGKEPKTGDRTPGVAVWATMAMISGLLYVLLYFNTEQGGMTEEDKNEIVARLIAWAKRGGILRRYAALALVFCVLLYYHSIGKYTEEKFEWSLVYMTHM